MFRAMQGDKAPMESFYDGYIVNALLDACFQSAESRKWEPIQIDDWRAAAPTPRISMQPAMIDGMAVVKEERMHGNKLKQILCDQATGKIVERVVDIE
jgi:hypothetical protein